MKRKNQILIIALIVIMIIFSILIYNSNSQIKTIKSEKELLHIYNSEDYNNIPFAEKVITLPFSLLFQDNYHRRNYDVVYGTNTQNGDMETKKDAITSAGSTKDYSKTNIQVEGVDEADIVKTNGDYIYSISENNIVITNAKDASKIKIESMINTESAIPNDLLLYNDKLVIFSTDNQNRYSKQNTIVEIYDVSDAKNPRRIKSFELYEPYYTTRCIDGRLYVFSKGLLRKTNNKVERKYKEDNKTKEIALNKIKYLKNNKYNVQTLIAELDLNNISDIKLNSYLIDISNAYVSKENIYLLDQDYYSDVPKISSIFTLKGVFGIFDYVDDNYDDTTHIYKFSINKNKGVSLKSNTELTGKIVNQYSVDEKDGNLRIALQSDDGTRIVILDNKLNILGETESVAEGERMYASRFMGDKAYLVTYRNTDPLFAVDLSNVKEPKVMGELKIPGYSTYLHPYDETHLIGIGMDTEEHVNRDSDGKVISTWVTTNGMKMCLFDVSDINNPKEIAKTTIGDRRTVSAILSNPKALLFSKEKNLLAIPVNNYADDFEVTSSTTYEDEINSYTNYNKNRVGEGYFVYSIDLDNGFNLKGTIKHDTRTSNDYYYYYRSKLLRGLYIDDDLYTVSESSIKVNNLDNLTEISSLNINDKGAENNEE